MDKLKKRIRQTILDEKVPVTMEVPNHYEATRLMFHDWMNLLDELLVPGSHQVGSTVLKSSYFSATQILCEINFGDFVDAKTAIFTISAGLDS